MEEPLRQKLTKEQKEQNAKVAILIIMEEPLRQSILYALKTSQKSRNPYYNGRASKTKPKNLYEAF